MTDIHCYPVRQRSIRRWAMTLSQSQTALAPYASAGVASCPDGQPQCITEAAGAF